MDDELLPLCSQIFRRDIRASSELTHAEAVKALGFLKHKATEAESGSMTPDIILQPYRDRRERLSKNRGMIMAQITARRHHRLQRFTM